MLNQERNGMILTQSTKKIAAMSTLIFTADNKISDEAILACQICGVDPNDLLGK